MTMTDIPARIPTTTTQPYTCIPCDKVTRREIHRDKRTALCLECANPKPF